MKKLGLKSNYLPGYVKLIHQDLPDTVLLQTVIRRKFSPQNDFRPDRFFVSIRLFDLLKQDVIDCEDYDFVGPEFDLDGALVDYVDDLLAHGVI